MFDTQPLTVLIDGQTTSLGLLQDIDNDLSNPLVRAVIMSLFTWRRANDDDVLPNQGGGQRGSRMGWWGDSFPPAPNDRIGSRLWLLARAKLTDATAPLARSYATEALQWLIDDGVVARIEVTAQRLGQSTLALTCSLYAASGALKAAIGFKNIWGLLNV